MAEEFAREKVWRDSSIIYREFKKEDYRKLIHVDFSNDPWPPPSHLIRNATNLQTLVVGGPRCTDQEILPLIDKLESLRTLVLDSTDVTDRAIEILRRTRPNLLVLRSQRWAIDEIMKTGGQVVWERQPGNDQPELLALLGDGHFRNAVRVTFTWDEETGFSYPILNEQLMPLKYLVSVIYLDLIDTRINDAGMHYLRGLTNVEWLRIPLAEVRPESLALLKGMTNMRHFTGPVGDKGIKHLERFVKLESLSSSGADLTDAGLTHLRKLKQLKALVLSNTKVSDTGLLHLKELPRLRYLDVRGTGVSEQGLRSFQDHLNAAKAGAAHNHHNAR